MGSSPQIKKIGTDELPDPHPYQEQWARDLEVLRQHDLLNEDAFLRFAADRGIAVWSFSKVASDLHERGWLNSDGTDCDGGRLFHPFRIYPLHQILQACELRIAPLPTLHRDRMRELIERSAMSLPRLDLIEKIAQERNRIVDLAVLLEPVYWPDITSQERYVDEDEYNRFRSPYIEKALDVVRDLDKDVWRQKHELLRFDAGKLEDNPELYLLLRLSTWRQREKLKGRISGALWIRHIAEVIRRAFEQVHCVEWLEEDQGAGRWPHGTRKLAFGSERPLDYTLLSKPYLAWRYGLFTGSVVRWYVEGITEYGAIEETLPKRSGFGIELVNLKGEFTGRPSTPLKLQDHLEEDKRLRRFSIISFDGDVRENVKVIQRQVDLQNVVGLIFPHKPDFEFANFTVQELAEVAARLDEAAGFPGDPVRNATWDGVNGCRAFEMKYTSISARRPGSLKGEEWGRALAKYAAEHPNRSDNGTERLFWKQIDSALRSRIWNYDRSIDRYRFDPDTFELVEIKENAD